MMTDRPLSMPTLMAGNGIGAVEARMQQLEAMIQAVEGNRGGAAQSAMQSSAPTSFKNHLDQAASSQAFGSVTGEMLLNDAGLSQPLPDSLKARQEVFRPMIQELSARHGVDENLVHAVIRQESGYNPGAVSKAGARGLMQLMPGTAKSLGVTDPLNPAQNLEGGIRHLKGLLGHYHGNIPLALAAYNAGSGAVKKHNGVPPYRETQHYVKNVLSMYLQNTKNS